MTRTKKSLLMSIVSMLLCLSMLMGTTYAWFTDSVATTGNRIVSGSLKIDLLHYSDSNWVSLKDHPDHKILNYNLWEPGHTRYERLQIKNLGNLALKYVLSATVEGGATYGANGERLSDVIDVYISRGDRTPASFAELKADPNWTRTGTLTSLLYGAGFASGSLIPGTNDSEYVSIAFHMQESAGNEYQNLSVGDIHITLVATQYTYESDSFGNQYDKDSIFPDNKMSYTYTAPVTLTADNKAASDVALGESDKAQAIVPAGTKLKAGISELVFTVTDMTTPSNILVDADEDSRAVDVHVEGLASDNDVPVIVYLKEYMPTGLNMGNYTLYHVENGTNVPMTYVADEAELDAHNEFTYDPATGDVKTALKSFSLVISVAETDFSWHGGVDHTWYMSHKKDTVLYISNADQLWSFSQIVGCMADWDGSMITSESSFKGKTIKLTSDINLGGAENDRNVDEHGNPHLFYPIGYYNSDIEIYKNKQAYEKNPKADKYISSYFNPFEGTFDGQGHTISNIYMNTWELKGDNEYYTAQQQCFRDGMGLFGKVWGGTVKNLTVANFTSDGEYTTTGVIAAYADSADGRSAVFENIAIKNCNPRVYNIGNGGIVGCVGWYSRNKTDLANIPVQFKNITVDNTNKISALWGSWDVACGGIVGTYYPDSGCGVTLDNCHVAAQIDVFNDVCGNYQYYWYRYAGMIIGTIRNNVTINDPNYPTLNGYTVPDLSGIKATGCTVHFGDWNNYYYCEMVCNSIASYTHDHQFSRLTQVQSVDVEKMEITKLDGTTVAIPTSGRQNYVVVSDKHSTENATCYHFVDGEVWNHEDAGTEVVNGETVLKEDKQHVFLPFWQLFQGNGWGIKHVLLNDNLKDAANYFKTKLEIKILDRDIADSVDKFKPVKSYLNEAYQETQKQTKPITIGSLFTEIVNDKVPLNAANVYITVEFTNGARITSEHYTLTENENWADRAITFTAAGQYKISVQDYYYCNPASVIIDVQPSLIKNENLPAYAQGDSTQPTLPTYYVGYHGEWSANLEDNSSRPTEVAVNNPQQYLLDSIGWRSEGASDDAIIKQTIKTDEQGNPIQATDEEGNLLYDENGDPIYEYDIEAVNQNEWIATYIKQTGGKFVAIREMFVTSTVQILNDPWPIMFTTLEGLDYSQSGDANYGKFLLHNLGNKDEALWISCEAIFDNIIIKRDPAELKNGEENNYKNSIKVTNTGRVVMTNSVGVEGEVHIIVDQGGYLWLDTTGFASYTGKGAIVVGANLMTHLQSASGKEDLVRFWNFIQGGGILVDEYGRQLKIYKYSYSGSGNVDYVLSRADDTLTLSDEAIKNINAENYAGVPDLPRYVQYVAQGGKITDKNGVEIVLHQFTSTGKYLITNTSKQVPVLEGGELVYKSFVYFAPNGTGNGSTPDNAVSDVNEVIEFVGDNGTIALTNNTIDYINSIMIDYTAANATATEKEIITKLYDFQAGGGKLVDKDGNAIVLKRVFYDKDNDVNRYQYIITDTDLAVARVNDGVLSYEKVLYVTNGKRGNGFTAEHGVYYFKTLLNEGGSADYFFKDATGKINGYKLVLDDAAIHFTACTDTDDKNALDFINNGGKIVDSNDNEINVFKVTKYDAETGKVPSTSYLHVHSTKGIAYSYNNTLTYTTKLFYAHNGNGKGIASAEPLRSLDEAIEALGTIEGRSIAIKPASIEYLNSAKGQKDLAKLYDFQEAGGIVKLHTGVTDEELVFQDLTVDKYNKQYLLKTTGGLFVYGAKDYRAEIHVGATATANTVSTLADAYAQLGTNDGTIVLDGTLTLSENFVEPAHTGTVTVTGGTISTNGANRQYYLNGPTTFDNITFSSSNEKGMMIVAQYYPVEIGKDVKCVGFTTSKVEVVDNFTVIGGFNASHARTNLVANRTIKNSHVVVRGGQRVYILGLDYNSGKKEIKYDSEIDIYGGTIYRVYAAGYGVTSSNNTIRITLYDYKFAKNASGYNDAFIDLNNSFAGGKKAILKIHKGNFTNLARFTFAADKTTIYMNETKVTGWDKIAKKENYPGKYSPIPAQ